MTISGALSTLTESWGADTSSKVSPEAAKNLARAHLSNGNRIKFLWRYVSLSTPLSTDITAEELEGIVGAGLTCLLVQHVNYPGWMATCGLGSAHGVVAAKHAKLVGYLEGCHLALDLEGVNADCTAQQVIDYVNAWCRAVIAAGFKPVLYVGYACGLTPEQLWELPLVDRYWSDFGSRHVPNRGFCMIQKVQEVVAGIKIDPDKHQPDSKGGVLVGMGKL